MSLLLASDPQANDIKLQHISYFGGKDTMELLEKFSGIEEFPEIISSTLKLYGVSEIGTSVLLEPPKNEK